MSLEVERARVGESDAFWRRNDRDWRSEAYGFRVVWHEQTEELVARDVDAIVGALRLRIAASLAHVDALYVVPSHRRRALGRLLVSRAEEIANYQNCHKMTVGVIHDGAAQRFFEACAYKLDAVLAQHTFKLDIAVMRKFLL